MTSAAPAQDIIDAPPDLDGLGLGDINSGGKCTRREWCLKEPGHRGNCRRYAPGDPRGKKGSSKPGPARKPGAAPPRRSRSRPTVLPAAWSFVYGAIGQAIEAQGPEPAAPPVGRVMQFQAPLAGERLHALASKVPIYREATALAGGGLLDDVIELIAAPLLVGVMASSEQARMTLWPILAASLQGSAVQIAKMQAQQREAMEQVGEFTAEADEIMRQMADSLFAPRWNPAEEPAPADG